MSASAVKRWVQAQLNERAAVGLDTSDEDAALLREWAEFTEGASREPVLSDESLLWLLAGAWIFGVIFTAAGLVGVAGMHEGGGYFPEDVVQSLAFWLLSGFLWLGIPLLLVAIGLSIVGIARNRASK